MKYARPFLSLFCLGLLAGNDLYTGQLAYADQNAAASWPNPYIPAPNDFPHKANDRIKAGDKRYNKSQFERAFEQYVAAEEELARLEHVDENWTTLVHLRKLLASYRMGRYDLALGEIRRFVDREVLDGAVVSPEMLKNILEIGSISLFQLQNKSLFLELTHSPKSFDLQKQIVIKALALYAQSGDTLWAYRLANNLQKAFSLSKTYPDFLDVWMRLAEKTDDPEAYALTCYQASTEIAKDSLWRKRFTLTPDEDKKRREILSKKSLFSAAYFEKRGQQTGSKPDFLKAAQIYAAQLAETTQTAQRDRLRLLAAQNFSASGDNQTALSLLETLTETSIGATDKNLMLATFLLKIGALKTNISAQPEDTSLFLDYQQNTLDFFQAFPHNQNAQDALFECANYSEKRGYLVWAQTNYAKLFFAPDNGFPGTSFSNKDLYAQALMRLLQKNLAPTTDDLLVAEKLEILVGATSRKIDLKARAAHVHAQLAKRLYDQWIGHGKNAQGAEFLMAWCLGHKDNFLSGGLYQYAIETFMDAQNWSRVYEASIAFQKIYPDHPMLPLSFFWQGRALEQLLQFEKAAQAYEKSVLPPPTGGPTRTKDSWVRLLTPTEKRQALDKALFLYDQLSLNRNAARVLHTMVLLQKTQGIFIPAHDSTRAQKQLLEASFYRKEKDFQKAKTVYQAILQDTAAPKKTHLQANMLLCVSRAQHKAQDPAFAGVWGDRLPDNRPLSPLAQTDVAACDRLVAQNGAPTDAVRVLNQLDEELFVRTKSLFFQTKKAVYLDSLAALEKRLASRVTYTQRAGVSESFADTLRIASWVAKGCREVYQAAGALIPAHGDSYLKKANQYKILSRQYAAKLALLQKKPGQQAGLGLGSLKEEMNRLIHKRASVPSALPLSLPQEGANFDNASVVGLGDVFEALRLGEGQRAWDKTQTLLKESSQQIAHLKNGEYWGQTPSREFGLAFGLASEALQDNGQAQKAFERAVWFAPSWEPAYQALSQHYVGRGAFALAQAVATKALDRVSDPSAGLWAMVAWAQMAGGQIQEALVTLRRGLALFPADPQLLGWQGIGRVLQKDPVAGCGLLQQVFEKHTEQAFFLYATALCTLQSGDLGTAHTAILRATDLYPAAAGFYYLGGLWSLQQDDKNATRLYWENYLRLADQSDERTFFVKERIISFRNEESIFSPNLN